MFSGSPYAAEGNDTKRSGRVSLGADGEDGGDHGGLFGICGGFAFVAALGLHGFLHCRNAYAALRGSVRVSPAEGKKKKNDGKRNDGNDGCGNDQKDEKIIGSGNVQHRR